MSTPYKDPSNRKFCGSWEGDCSLENHCPTGEECDILSGLSCFETTSCHAHELLIELLGQEGVDSLIGGDEEEGISGKMDPNDPRRNNFCGTSWGSANSECSQPCPGGEGAFKSTPVMCLLSRFFVFCLIKLVYLGGSAGKL